MEKITSNDQKDFEKAVQHAMEVFNFTRGAAEQYVAISWGLTTGDVFEIDEEGEQQ